MALDFAAGCLGGCAGIIFGYPFDTVKVKIQMQTPNQKLYRGTYHCLKTTLAKESIAGLYRGLSSPMAGVALINAVVFGVYGNIQKRSADPNSIKTHFWAGTTAGLVQTIITSPMELTKTRMQIQSSDNTGPKFKGPIECVRHIHQMEGIRGLFRGFGITAIRDVPGFASYFVFYELMIRTSPCPGGFHTLMAGGFAGVLSWIISCPIDVIKTRLQADGMTTTCRYNGISDCVRKSYQAEGFSFLTKGMCSTLLRAFIMNSVCFYVVAYTMKLCDDSNLKVDIPKLEPIIVSAESGNLQDSPSVVPLIKNLEIYNSRYDLSRTFNYMSALSDAVYVNEIIDETCCDNANECNCYYKLNGDTFEDIRLITDNGSSVIYEIT